MQKTEGETLDLFLTYLDKSLSTSMNITTKFERFCSNLELTEESLGLIALRYGRICQRINSDFWEIDSASGAIFIGSFGRRTAIQMVLAVDLIFPLPYWIESASDDDTPDEQARLMSKMKASLKKSFPTSKISDDKCAVNIDFGENMIFNIIPVLDHDEGGFIYADLRGNSVWRTIDPEAELEAITFGNKLTNYNLQRLCRMLKAWKNYNKVPMRDLLLDTMAYRFLTDWEDKKKGYDYYPKMILEFFEFLTQQNGHATEWEALGSRLPVYSLGNFTFKAKLALELVELALDYESKGDFPLAHLQWKGIFGEHFPN